MYLTLSLLFFAVLKLGGPAVVDVGNGTAPVAQQARAAQVSQGGDEEQAMRDMAVFISPALSTKVNAFLQLPDGEKNRVMHGAFFKYVPYAMFLLMPLFALYLKILYLGSGRRYGEHLLFALHSNAFAFAMFSVLILTGRIDIGLLTFACVLWLLAWLPLAMQRVYGGARWLTFLRWQALSVLHLLSIGAGIIAALGLAVAI